MYGGYEIGAEEFIVKVFDAGARKGCDNVAV
jgi:hypothetical protein